MTRILCAFFLLIHFCSFQSLNNFQDDIQNSEPQKVDVKGFDNLYKIDDSLYRSEQPNKKGMMELKNLGIKTVINFRNRYDDIHENKKAELALVHIPINTWKISEADIREALMAFAKSEKPVLVHCLHGSDRTGAFVASYRIVFQNWSREEAIAEFREPRFGFHEKWFPNILELLETIDFDKLRTEVLNS